MPEAISGAEYHDSVFGSDCTVQRVYVGPRDSEYDSDIVVELSYETLDEPVCVRLEAFREATGFDLIDIPADS